MSRRKNRVPFPTNPDYYRAPAEVLAAGFLILMLTVLAFNLGILSLAPGLWPLAFAFDAPTVLVSLGLLAFGGLAHLSVEHFGYDVEPLAAGTSGSEVSDAALKQTGDDHLGRTLACALPGIVAFGVLRFYDQASLIAYVVGIAVTVVLFAAHVRVNSKTVARLQASLEAEGVESRLDELLGFAPWTGTDADLPTPGDVLRKREDDKLRAERAERKAQKAAAKASAR